MLRILAAPCAAFAIIAGVAWPRGLAAQDWNDERTRALVERATERRAQQLADTGLADYRATARGYLTFLAQLGEGFTEPPRIVKADELALEVYWKAPNLSKQRIIGRRDTLLLPTDVEYHHDHLGIVQNNFPEIIRLGEGDEVVDVPHPLSVAGLGVYDFAISDSLRMRLPDRVIEMYEVKVRPRDDRQPRVIGALYLDRATGEVVRMAFNFTRSAYRDRQLEGVSIVLENALIDGFWLPRRQEIEIVRTGAWLDYPARGIIRGRWEICCYALNQGLSDRLFAGPEIVSAPPRILREYRWEGAVLDSLPPDVRAVTNEEVRRVQAEARALVRAEALARARTATLSARGASELLRVNRVEGLGVGAGVALRAGKGVRLETQGRYGFADEQAKGRLSLGWEDAEGRGVGLNAFREYREAGDVPERSLVVNSLAAQEFGSDYTDPYDVRGFALRLDLGALAGARWRLEGAREWHAALAVHARPAFGRFQEPVAAEALRATRVTLAASRPTRLWVMGTELRWDGELRGTRIRATNPASGDRRPVVLRGSMQAELERPYGRQRLVLRTTLAGVGGVSHIPAQELVYLGGPITGPGYRFHTLVGRFGASQRLEWRRPVRWIAIPLGRFGTVPAEATLAPFAHAAVVRAPLQADPSAPDGIYPAVGIGLLTLFDVVRVDLARGLRDGRWTFGVDVARDLWPIL